MIWKRLKLIMDQPNDCSEVDQRRIEPMIRPLRIQPRNQIGYRF